MGYMDSFGYVVSSLSEIARTLEFNADGLARFWFSSVNLLVRVYHWGASAVTFFIKWIKKIAEFLTN